MKIIHTSDWHLGQYFYTKNRLHEHQQFSDWLINLIEKQQVDALIIAGDIFDTASPPSYARELYNQFVAKLQRTGCHLIVLAGNHDAVATLNESRELLACLNVNVVARPDPEQDLIVLYNKQKRPGAIVCAIPFLRPRDILLSQAGQSESEKQQALLNAIQLYYQSLYDKAMAKRTELSADVPIIMTGHLTTVGAKTTDSVRDIYIGTLEAFPAGAFPPADYIALGHIHRAQNIGDSGTVRYSGSPVPLSFDETGQEKSVFLLTLNDTQITNIEPVTVPCFQPMVCLKGDLDTISRALSQFPLRDEKIQPVWLDIEIAGRDYLPDIQKRIQALTEPYAAEVVLLRRERRKQQWQESDILKETLNELTTEEVFARRLALSDTEEDAIPRLTTLFRQVCQQVSEDQKVKSE
ncbi:exonuclease subunit SbcD [Morganella psychrotolerans]|uniref:Nuclease SbcCD subunit D n=1 Tax=Morganella psychrotolerans TaxID=368603 RepID=A0A5M9QZE0_9GAMM|nr:exonuclease subunit SbcD [Morganella psychrotolerans]KAA8713561.1 exonuclease subunit SbcD [Morganella psychrotolerans]OBU02851.1 exonuclease subunit SbcD [Morganella psychrotolerans]